VLEQIAGRIVGKVLQLLFGVEGLGDAAHGIVGKAPGALGVVPFGGQVAGRVVIVVPVDLLGGAPDALPGDPVGFGVAEGAL
jgi:hypothetical protein